MSAPAQPRLVTPVPTAPQPEAPRRRLGQAGLRLNVRGRSIPLRGLRRQPTGILAVLAILGPGIVAGMAGDDAGGVATYSQTGAKFGYGLLWVMVVITVSLAVVQEMCARLGAATGRGLVDLIRERFGIGWTLFAIVVVLVANSGVTITEFVGVAASAELLGVSRYLAVPLAAALLWYLVIAGSYGGIEKVLLAMTLTFIAYPIAAILAQPDWGEVARGAVVPAIQRDPDFLTLLVALVGTTITPYMQLFQQSAVVEKGVARVEYGPERADVYSGAVLGNLVSAFIIIATGATLHVAGTTDIQTAAEAAQALQPVAGNRAAVLFAVGLLGASLIAAAVLPLATAYSVAEAFGFRKGIHLDFRRARIFLGLFTTLMTIGAVVALVPNVPVIALLVGVQVLNGSLLPVVLLFILLLVNDARLTGSLKNGGLHNVLGWGTWLLVTTAVVILLGSQALGAFGIDVLGG